MAKSSYFDNMIRQYGDEDDRWLVAATPEDIQHATKKIVKDMVRGHIDYGKYGKYFLEGKFIDNLLVATTNELEIHSLHYNAMCMYRNAYPMIPNMSIHINHDEVMYRIYSVIVERLQMVKLYQNVGYLADVSALLVQYKNHLV